MSKKLIVVEDYLFSMLLFEYRKPKGVRIEKPKENKEWTIQGN
jgi:hypothetical protein